MEEKKVNKYENRNRFIIPELYPVYILYLINI